MFGKLVTKTLIGIFFLVNVLVPNSVANAATQRVSYSIAGDCVDYFDENGEYAFFEEELDWSCYIVVKVTPTKPIRTVRLQYWSGRKWQQESSSKTNTKGVAYLNFDPYCDEGYCDGEWKYRVYVDSASGQKSNTSNTFYVTFYPGTEEDNY